MLIRNDMPGEYPPSYYAATANQQLEYPALRDAQRCDVCVIGGGYTGLSTALHLAERGVDTVLVDAHRVGWGASGRNGGQVCSGQRVGQSQLEEQLGVQHAQALWRLGEAAKALVYELIERHAIDCDLKRGIIHADHRARFVASTHAYVDKLRRDYDYHLVEPLDRAQIRAHLDTEDYFGGAIDRGAAHLHPLNYALGIARAAKQAGARLFERTQVTGWREGQPCEVLAGEARIVADRIVFACNGYLDALAPPVGRRIMPINNFIIATEPLSVPLAASLIREDTAVSDSRFVINYYRLSADRRLLFGGGENYRYRFPADIRALVRPCMLKVYPQLRDVAIDYAWGGTLAITINRLPYFARVSRNVLSAGGYSGQGVALATLAGSLIAAEIADDGSEEFDLMARVPTPVFPGGRWLRWPLLVAAMSWYALRDRF